MCGGFGAVKLASEEGHWLYQARRRAKEQPTAIGRPPGGARGARGWSDIASEQKPFSLRYLSPSVNLSITDSLGEGSWLGAKYYFFTQESF